MVPRHGGDLWQLVVALGVAGQVPLFAAGGRSGKLLVLLALSLAALYPAIGVPFFPWYILPMVVAVLYGIPYLIGAAARWLARSPSPRRCAAAAVAGCLLAAPGARGGLMPVAAPWFKAAYAPAARIDQLVIFERRPGVALPAPDSPLR